VAFNSMESAFIQPG